MNSNDFVNWLKGYLDGINGVPNEDQLATIKSKLNSTYPYYYPYTITTGTNYGYASTAGATPLLNTY